MIQDIKKKKKEIILSLNLTIKVTYNKIKMFKSQVNNMVISFNFPQNGNLTFECLLFQSFTIFDSKNNPNVIMFSFNNTENMNDYWLSNQNLINTNFELGNNYIIFEPIVINSCNSSPTCGSYGSYSCSTYCKSTTITNYYYNTTIEQ